MLWFGGLVWWFGFWFGVCLFVYIVFWADLFLLMFAVVSLVCFGRLNVWFNCARLFCLCLLFLLLIGVLIVLLLCLDLVLRLFFVDSLALTCFCIVLLVWLVLFICCLWVWFC